MVPGHATRPARHPDRSLAERTLVDLAGVVPSEHLDSWAWHRTRRAFQRDRDKGNLLATHGIALLRFTERDLTDRPHAVATRIGELLARSRAA